jgi:hypothetical protein
MDLTLCEGCSITFGMKFIAVISHDNYYIQFYCPCHELVQ